MLERTSFRAEVTVVIANPVKLAGRADVEKLERR